MASTAAAAAVAAAAAGAAAAASASGELSEAVLAREERRAAQEYRWKQDAKIDGREQLAFREAAIVHARKFKLGIGRFRLLADLAELTFDKTSWLYRLPREISLLIVMFVCGEEQGSNFSRMQGVLAKHDLDHSMEENETRVFHVLSRCRPLSAGEIERGDYSSVSGFANLKNLAVHDGKVHRSGNEVAFDHHVFRFTRTLDQRATNDDLRDAFKPYLDAALTRSGIEAPATFIFYGQTGTGKTYSMGAVLDEVAECVAARWRDGTVLEIAACEIIGKNNCHDMLADRKKLKVLSDREGRAHVRGAHKIKFESRPEPELISKVFESVMESRTSIATQENERSSRSHLMIELRFAFDGQESSITLVDLAGSEMNYETAKHDRRLHRQAADINLALMALKRCFQSYYHVEMGASKVDRKVLLPLDQRRKIKRGGKKHVTVSSNVRAPFRACMLTRLLRECFVRERASTVLLCCYSPASSAVTHSINSMDSLQLMKTHLPKATFSDAVRLRDAEADRITRKPVHEWTTEDVKDWVATTRDGKFSHIVLPPNVRGADLVKLSANRFARLFESENLREAREEREGRAWAIGAEQLDLDAPGTRLSQHYDLGREIWSALREHQRDYFDSTLLGK